MKLRHDLLDGRDRLLAVRLATALAEYYQRTPDAQDYEAATRMLCRRGGPLARKDDTWRSPDVTSLIG
jgi:hypothetical protein